MPRLAPSRVNWSITRQTYLVEAAGTGAPQAITPDSPAWFGWLARTPSFAFHGQVAHFTARKEQRPRGEGYWYAYRGSGQKLSKRYLGKTGELTLARLEQVASDLAAAGADGTTAGPDARQRAIPTPPDLLLGCKIRAPQLRTHRVARAHLVERLRRGAECPLTLV
ncbi:MAG TPA: hypothetical protein VGR57_13785, partial [Ktedonobacterales bacterium]|nr:hypothetical protein [Ktedonobacterales bacterium]